MLPARDAGLDGTETMDGALAGGTAILVTLGQVDEVELPDATSARPLEVIGLGTSDVMPASVASTARTGLSSAM